MRVSMRLLIRVMIALVVIVSLRVFMLAGASLGVSAVFMAMVVTAGACLAVLMLRALRAAVFVVMTTGTGRRLHPRIMIVAALASAGMLPSSSMLLILML